MNEREKQFLPKQMGRRLWAKSDKVATIWRQLLAAIPQNEPVYIFLEHLEHFSDPDSRSDAPILAHSLA